MFLCVRGIDFLRFLVEFLEMFRQCDMFCFSFYLHELYAVYSQKYM